MALPLISSEPVCPTARLDTKSAMTKRKKTLWFPPRNKKQTWGDEFGFNYPVFLHEGLERLIESLKHQPPGPLSTAS